MFLSNNDERKTQVSDLGLEEYREYYEHDANCSKENFTEPNERGIKTCLDCAGQFKDSDGKGIAKTAKVMDKYQDGRHG